MVKKKFRQITDEDGIVIFDESDDFFPGERDPAEEFILEDREEHNPAEEFILEDPEETFIEYLERETARQEAEKRAEQKRQRWISVGVIAAVVLYVGIITYINIKDLI